MELSKPTMMGRAPSFRLQFSRDMLLHQCGLTKDSPNNVISSLSLFTVLLQVFNKSYPSQEEHDHRALVFANNLEFIRNHNADSTQTCEFFCSRCVFV